MRAITAVALVAALAAPMATLSFPPAAPAADPEWTFESALRQSAGHPSSAILPNVPDAIELAFWRCVASAYVHTQIPTSELGHLDELARAGRWDDPDMRWRLDRWATYLRTQDPAVTDSIDAYATQSPCAADYNAFLKELRS